MPRPISNLGYVQLHLPPILEAEVDAWSKQGWAGVTQTTHDLLSYWFNRDEETEERFYFSQQRAVETFIYCRLCQLRCPLRFAEAFNPPGSYQNLLAGQPAYRIFRHLWL